MSTAEREAVSRLLSLRRLAAQDLDAQRTAMNLRPASFVTESQTLSLRFGSHSLPAPGHALRPGRLYSIRLSVCNEFGLWSREHLDRVVDAVPRPSPKVYCEVISLPLMSQKEKESPQQQQKQFKGARSLSCPDSAPGLSLHSTSENSIGENGRVDFTFRLDTSANWAAEGSLCECILLKFSCAAPLPSGHVVAPIVSLPMFVHAGEQHEEDTAAGAGAGAVGCSRCIGDSDSNSMRHIISQCSELSGQSIKIFDPSPPSEHQLTDFAAPSSAVRSNGLIYALECPGSLGIGGK